MLIFPSVNPQLFLLYLHDGGPSYTISQTDGRAGMDFKMAFSVVSPVWMRKAAYEEALLDIDGDKDVSTNEALFKG